MSFTVRNIETQDAEMVNQWMNDWKLSPYPLNAFPQKGLVLLNETNTAIYAGYVWTDPTCKMAQIGFITRNPNITIKDKTIRRKFVEELSLFCRDLGYELAISWNDNEHLKSDFRATGYTETSNKVSEFIVELKK